MERNSGGRIFLGCAGWSVTAAEQHRFPREGSHLERYASVLPAVEINSSFYRPHRAATYARWRDSVPENFRFSVKLPCGITHERRLRGAENDLQFFLDAVHQLEQKLGCLLVQLPPSLRFDAAAAKAFFERLRASTESDVVCEPRHASWFTGEAAGMLAGLGIARVIADPAVVADPAPPQYEDCMYVRLHGSPVIYHSNYSADYLDRLARELIRYLQAGRRVWCVFDNTANGAAMSNALRVLDDLRCSVPLQRGAADLRPAVRPAGGV